MRKFGHTMAIAFSIIGGLLWWRHKSAVPYLIGAAAFFELFALFLPDWLVPVEKFWMKLAHVLGWINMRIILGILFYAVFTPFRLFLFLLRKDLLDQAIEKDRKSYWIVRSRPAVRPESYEKMY